MHRLEDRLAVDLARLAVDNVDREYPNAPGHLLTSPQDLRQPRELHPAFFGSWDWHSSVHQHWLLARLLRLGRAGAQADAARAALASHLTAPKLAAEAAYLRERPAFERTYGWAWLLKLADELAAWADAGVSAWRDALEPAIGAVRASWMAYLPLAAYPIRAGTHANSAFGLLLALEHARAFGDGAFAAALEERARAWFAEDRDHPAQLEPSGDDFLSPALLEAALMAVVLGPVEFPAWLSAFLPGLVERRPGTLFEPAGVADRTDPKTVHLDGLNLSRAWSWRRLAAALPDDPRAEVARAAAERHLEAALPHVFSGHFSGEHWVGSFALLALTEPP
jgi:hypothetical protein